MVPRRTTRYARRGDAQLAYQIDGDGPPVVCLLGTISGLALWENRIGSEYFDPITRFARVVAVDPRGTGRSSIFRLAHPYRRPPGSWTHKL